MERRDFLLLLTLGFSLKFNTSCSENKKFLGKLSELEGKETFHEFNGNQLYLTFIDKKPQILSLTCTHKKCTVKMNKNSDTWLCPCHKGEYSKEGKRIKGKPPRDLYVYDYEIINDSLWVINQVKNP